MDGVIVNKIYTWRRRCSREKMLKKKTTAVSKNKAAVALCQAKSKWMPQNGGG